MWPFGGFEDWAVGDMVMHPNDESSIGRVFDIKENGLHVYVHRLDGTWYYTDADQLVRASLLDRLARAADGQQ